MTTTLNASNSGSGGLVATADASGVLALQTAGTTAVTVNASQNVGIGTTSPSYKLNVGDTSSVTTLNGAGITLFTSGTLTSNIGGVLNFRPGLGQTASDIFNLSICAYDHSGDTNADGLSINGSDGVSFSTGGNSRNERMRIDSSGNVFVGGTTQNASTKPVYASTTAKAWVNFGGAGTINGSFNVSSVTRTSTGNFDVNFSSAMPNANFAATANSWQSVSNSNVSYNVFNFTTAKYQITTFENGSGTNPNATYSIVFAT